MYQKVYLFATDFSCGFQFSKVTVNENNIFDKPNTIKYRNVKNTCLECDVI